MVALDSSESPDKLTEREIEILKLISDGYTNREISEELFLSIETIRWYSKRIYSKLHVRNRMQAAVIARESNLIPESPDSEPSSDLPRYSLPAQVTAFVGRSQELSDLANILENGNNRLITILAPGGMGKTRLAIQVAKANITTFSDGVFYIPLEHMTTRDQLVTAVIEVLNIQLSVSSKPEQQLLEYLKNKNMLLLLDNFEELVSESTLIADMLANSSALKIVVTSRECLGLNGETIYDLKGLEIPQSEEKKLILKSSAIQLFVQSAKLVKPNYTAIEADLPHLINICRLVEGMPLGILLAAAWIAVLSPQEIATEINRNLDFLRTEKKDVPERQKSIQVVFDYSIKLLEEKERLIFFKLSVFQGSFSRQAASVVTGAEINDLACFAEKSLLQYDPYKKRYRLHALLRQYALNQLQTDNLIPEVFNDHKAFFKDFLTKIEDKIKGPNQLQALEQIHEDLENIRGAWHWALEQDDFSFIDQSFESMYWFCILRGHIADGKVLFHKARAQFLPNLETRLGLRQYRLLVRFDASGEVYKAQLEHALLLARKGTDRSVLAFLSWAYGVNAYVMQDFEQAIESLEEALNYFQDLNDPFYTVETLHLLWICNRFLGNINQADVFYQQGLEISRREENKIAISRALGSGGAFLFIAGSYQRAETATQEALDLRREIKDRPGEAMSLAMLSWFNSIKGNFSQAKLLAESGIRIATEVNSLNSKMTAMNALGWIACLENNFELAKELCHQSYTIAPDPTVKISAELVLAYTEYGLKDYQTSKTHLKEVLSFGSSTDGYGLMFLSLPLTAYYLSGIGEREKASDMVNITIGFPDFQVGWMKNSILISTLKDSLQIEHDGNQLQIKQLEEFYAGLSEIVTFALGLI